jgi:hypothetical protein
VAARRLREKIGSIIRFDQGKLVFASKKYAEKYKASHKKAE